jgi:hypothetical protein
VSAPLVLGIDPSSRRVGLALVTHDGHPVQCWSHPIEGGTWPEKLCSRAASRAVSHMLTVAAQAAYAHRADVACVYVEDTRTGGGRNSRATTWAAGGVTALLVDGCFRHFPGLDRVNTIRPDVWRREVDLADGGGKVEAVRKARALGWLVPDLVPTRGDHDAAEAALIAQAAVSEAARYVAREAA